MRIETIFSPAELPALAADDLRGAVCVVFDILRATSTIVTALHHGARRVVPVREIPEAIEYRQHQPEVLLAGERNGVRIRGDQSGGVDFHLGNSPREFRPERVRGRTIVTTTTNGTRALQACASAQLVLAASFLNLAATGRYLHQLAPERLLLVCAGTGAGVALEDVLAAGALAGLGEAERADATEIAVRAFLSAKADLPAVLAASQNARRLLEIPELRPDVAFCAQRDIYPLVAVMKADGGIEAATKGF